MPAAPIACSSRGISRRVIRATSSPSSRRVPFVQARRSVLLAICSASPPVSTAFSSDGCRRRATGNVVAVSAGGRLFRCGARSALGRSRCRGHCHCAALSWSFLTRCSRSSLGLSETVESGGLQVLLPTLSPRSFMTLAGLSCAVCRRFNRETTSRSSVTETG